MLTVGPLALAAPWMLLALGALPVLWWLMRATPPAPRRVTFPAVRLLLGLRADQPVSARTPWWLVFLRLVIAALVVVGLARPLLNPDPATQGTGPVLLVVDDTWAAAPTWGKRQAFMLDLADRLGRAGRSLLVMTTAAPVPGAVETPPDLLTAEAAATRLRAMEPRPWGKDLEAARARLEGMSAQPDAVVWVQDGLAAPGTGALIAGLRRFGRLDVRAAGLGEAPLVLRPPVSESDGSVHVTLARPEGDRLPPRALRLRARDDQGRVVMATEAVFGADAASVTVPLQIPPELAPDLARLEVEDAAGGTPGAHPGAAGVVLLDETWARRPVGLVSGDAATGSAPVPLLDETHYLRQALAPFAEVREGAPTDLIERDLSVLVMTDGVRLEPSAIASLRDWVRRGGTLVRFAGPRLTALHPDLLPVRLRAGERAMGGALSWSTPGHLSPFGEASPFAGLTVPGDVTITRQVLAEPAADLAAHTWARLTDGTPLVTAKPLGRGRVVLMHVTADPRWSTLAMSGLFVDMLRRLVDSSRGVVAGETLATTKDARLPPHQVLDGLGRLTDPVPGVAALSLADLETPTVTPAHPPGLYGLGGHWRALNLGAALTTVPRALTAADLPAGVRRGPLAGAVAERELMPPLLTTALVLGLLDLVLSVWLRGLLRPDSGRRRVAAGLALAIGLGGALSLIAPVARAQALDTDPRTAMALEAALETRLAWVKSGDPEVDRISEAGLDTLTTVLARRTSAELGPPMGVSAGTDPLVVFPLLYWPVVPGQGTLTASARAAVNSYLRHGGMILFDVHDGGDLAGLLDGVDVPPLMPLPEDHVLTRSFYLLDRFPGRRDGDTVWVERNPVTHDGVSSVVIGSHDWAAAWATDDQGRPLFATVPGGNRQREMAYRFGVNLVLYALTGNYKGDQVHLPAIIERLTN